MIFFKALVNIKNEIRHLTGKLLVLPLTLSIILWFLSSCQTDLYIDSIDLTRNDDMSVFDVFSEVYVVALETSEFSLITEIRRVQYFDDFYFILDQRSQQIFCFGESGKFIFKINAQGKGPGEYHYITDIAIDRYNRQIVVLDPVVQKVHFYDFDGGFVNTHFIKTEKVYGLNRVYPMKDSLLLLASITNEAMIIYSLLKEEITYAEFIYDVPSTLNAFAPSDNVFTMGEQLYFMPPLSQEVLNVTQGIPEPYFTWCFGLANNSDDQIQRLLLEIEKRLETHDYILLPFQAVGKNKALSNHIVKSFENDKYRIAIVEYDDDYKHVLIDKESNRDYIFNSFNEGIRLPYENLYSDKAIAFFKPEFGPWELSRIEQEGLQDYFFHRNQKVYSKEILNESCRQIIENHDPMNDNPYLVVYRFKE